jgi:hypothetical protein
MMISKQQVEEQYNHVKVIIKIQISTNKKDIKNKYPQIEIV